MGGRYIVTGTQLGMLQTFSEQKRFEEIEKMIDSILSEQFMGNADELIDMNDTYILEKLSEN